MNSKINEILTELYDLDSSLKGKETDLIKIIEKMLKSKPNIKIDEDFKANLKKQILEKITYKQENIFSIKDSFKYLWIFLSWAIAFSLIFSFYPGILSIDKNDDLLDLSGDSNLALNFSFVPEVKHISDNAFWELSFNKQISSWIWWAWVWWWWITTVESSTLSTKIRVDWDYIPKVYTYSLKDWEKLPEIPDSMLVYKKENKDMQVKSSILKDIFKTDIVDLSKFRDLWLSNLNLYENIDKWYQINISLREWIVNIYRNYSSWMRALDDSQDKLTIDNVPDDKKIVEIVWDFASKYSVDLSNYSGVLVDSSWKTYYENSDNKSDYYIPEILSVSYQLDLDWKSVYESNWYPYWLNASVNIRDMQVNSFWPINTYDLIWSNYELITENDRILEELKKWNYYYNSNYGIDSNFDEVKVEVWDAKIVYIREYIYNSENNVSEEYFVPWLLFKVFTETDSSNMIFPWNYVSIPLVWDFLEKNNDMTIIPLEIR